MRLKVLLAAVAVAAVSALVVFGVSHPEVETP